MSKMKRVLGSKAILGLGAWVAYVLVFILLYPVVGPTMAALAILPVVVMGWLFGLRTGSLAGLLSFPLNMLLMAVVTGTAWAMMNPGGLFGSVLILLIGAMVGRLHDSGKQVKWELAERKWVEGAVRESEEKYRTILENIEDGYYEVDLAGNLTFFNDSLCRLYGYSKEELMGMNYRQYMDGGTAKVVYQTFNAVYRTGNPAKAFDWEVIRKDGTRRFVGVSVSLIRDPTGEPIGFRGITRDITEPKRAEETLRESEERLATILDSLQTGAVIIDAETHVIVDVNPAAVDVIGAPKERVVGQACHKLICPAEVGKCPITDLGQTIDKSERVLINANGESIPVIKTVTPIILDGRKYLIDSFIDITERKRAEEALRVSEERFALAVQGSNDGIWDWDIQNNSLYWSPRLKELLGYTDDELDVDFDTFNLLLHPDDKERTGAAIEAHLKDRGLYDVEQRLRTKSGEYRWFRARGQALWDEAGQPVRMVGSTADITERKQAEEQLQRYAAELEQANEEVKQFAYIVSHDLRTPLVNLKGFTAELRFALEVIGGGMDTALPHLDEKQRQDVTMALQEDVPEALSFIESSVTSMDRFINALLKLSRLGHRELHPEPVDMDALVRATLQTLAHQIEERQVEVMVGPLPKVVADRTSMEQVMANLLDNAVKYLDLDRPGQIEITAERSHNETTFRIRDSGRGIAKEDMDKVFAPFRRIGRQDVPGEGMGLPYVQALVRRHGGRIWCVSEPGVGTTFSFTISNHIAEGGSHV
jgi:PAS domain S-box-containing protein